MQESSPIETVCYDVVIVGGGPAGLSAAIRLKQLRSDLNVCLLEKGSQIGAHILSGAVVEPSGLDALLPEWRTLKDFPTTDVQQDEFIWLSNQNAWKIPSWILPDELHNQGNFIASMGQVCQWLAKQAEQLGVEIYTGMAATSPCFDAKTQRLNAVFAGEVGRDADGKKGTDYQPPLRIEAKMIILAEGARGHLSQKIIKKYNLAIASQPQKYALGFKEIWQIPQESHKQGLVQHYMGWPLSNKAHGGGFLYHAGNCQIYLGLVIHLDYVNPHLSLYDEFQTFKTHPKIQDLLSNGQRLSYGGRVISVGGAQSLPQMTFPGGVLIGCAAGLVNMAALKGNHNAMLSGIMAAQSLVDNWETPKLEQGVLADYDRHFRLSNLYKKLYKVRNIKPLLSRFGKVGIVLSGLELWRQNILPTSFRNIGTLNHKSSDRACIQQANKMKRPQYARYDNHVTFDKMTNLAFSNTYHREGQPCHLKTHQPNIHISDNLENYNEPAQRYCPAGVYEILNDNQGGPRLQINAANCLHCKCCDIKDPAGSIEWTAPEGGGGPNYNTM